MLLQCCRADTVVSSYSDGAEQSGDRPLGSWETKIYRGLDAVFLRRMAGVPAYKCYLCFILRLLLLQHLQNGFCA